MQCADCPDLQGSGMPEGWTPRPRCCRDEHIDRRLAGSFEPWTNILEARTRSAEDEASKSRQQRRAEARAAKKGNRNA